MKKLLKNKTTLEILTMILIIVIVIVSNIFFKNHCVKNGGKLIVGPNGQSCIYDK